MEVNKTFDFFYGNEADTFTFFKIPKALIVNPMFKNVSNDAKILYGLMLDRMSLSVKNGWFDAENRVYINYSVEDAAECLNCSENTATKLFKELDSNGIGLIERVKQGQGKPAIIYVKNFLSVESDSEPQNLRVKNLKNCGSRTSEFAGQEPQNLRPNNTNTTQTYIDNTNLIDSKAEEEKLLAYEKLIKENIDYETLLIDYAEDTALIEGIYELIYETVISHNESMVISKDRYPMELVRSKFLKINSHTVRYVIKCLSENTSKVRNIKKYLLATLFNANTTMSSYYTAAVNHDMANYLTKNA